MVIQLKAWQLSSLRVAVFVLGLYPVFRWLYLGFAGGLTANPAEFLIRSSGIWATVLLWATLTVSPLRRLLTIPSLIRLRRPLGLFAFFYTCLHVLGWALWEHSWRWEAMLDDIFSRPFITLGTLATILMLALACTSTQSTMRRLGPKWKSLHRSIYAIAIFALVHFYLVRSGKNDFADVYVYGAILVVLLVARLPFARRLVDN